MHQGTNSKLLGSTIRRRLITDAGSLVLGIVLTAGLGCGRAVPPSNETSNPTGSTATAASAVSGEAGPARAEAERRCGDGSGSEGSERPRHNAMMLGL